MHSVWKNILIRYMEDAKVIAKIEILYMAADMLMQRGKRENKAWQLDNLIVARKGGKGNVKILYYHCP